MKDQVTARVARRRGRQVKIWLTESEYERLKLHAEAGDGTVTGFIARVVRMHLTHPRGGHPVVATRSVARSSSAGRN